MQKLGMCRTDWKGEKEEEKFKRRSKGYLDPLQDRRNPQEQFKMRLKKTLEFVQEQSGGDLLMVD